MSACVCVCVCVPLRAGVCVLIKAVGELGKEMVVNTRVCVCVCVRDVLRCLPGMTVDVYVNS